LQRGGGDQSVQYGQRFTGALGIGHEHPPPGRNALSDRQDAAFKSPQQIVFTPCEQRIAFFSGVQKKNPALNLRQRHHAQK